MFNVYSQIRTTRKILRLLRTLEYSTKIKQNVPKLQHQLGDIKMLINNLLSILQNLSTFLFYLSDHRVLFAELGVIDQSYKVAHYSKSYKFYLMENVFGALKRLTDMLIMLFENKYEGQEVEFSEATKLFKELAIDFIKCFLDVFVALHYLNGAVSANKASVIGVITSLIGISQMWKKK